MNYDSLYNADYTNTVTSDVTPWALYIKNNHPAKDGYSIDDLDIIVETTLSNMRADPAPSMNLAWLTHLLYELARLNCVIMF